MENLKTTYESVKLSKSKAWLMFLFFGWSYGSMDSIGKQILYYLTIGGFGVWTVYLFFTLNKKIKKHNRKVAMRLGMEVTDLMKNGLL